MLLFIAVWHVLLHELAHYKDIGLLGNDHHWRRYSRHDRRPVELRAENMVDAAIKRCPWQYASKELMAIGMDIKAKTIIKED